MKGRPTSAQLTRLGNEFLGSKNFGRVNGILEDEIYTKSDPGLDKNGKGKKKKKKKRGNENVDVKTEIV